MKRALLLCLAGLTVLAGCAHAPFTRQEAKPVIELHDPTQPERNFDPNQVVRIKRQLKDGEAIASKDDACALVLLAAMTRDKELLKLLKQRKVDLNQQDSLTHQAPLQQAVIFGDAQACAFLLKEGADPNQIAPNGGSALLDAVNLNSEPVVRALLEHGANPNQCEQVMGFSPLHSAVYEGPLAISEQLIKHGADVNLRDKRGQTPLHQAASLGRTQAVELLLKHGADLNVKSKAGVTPLKAAEQSSRKDTAALLRRHGAK